jgi:hypothetical protein
MRKDQVKYALRMPLLNLKSDFFVTSLFPCPTVTKMTSAFENIPLNQPVALVQLHRQLFTYGKALKSFEDRKGLSRWQDPLLSRSGHVEGGKLYLPQRIREQADFPRCNFISLEDLHPRQEEVAERTSPTCYLGLEPQRNACLDLTHPRPLHIFQLKGVDEKIEIYLRWGYFEVGEPRRDNIKLAELEAGKSVEIKINGKRDSSLTGRRERLFQEQHFIFEHLGFFTQCSLLPSAAPAVPKQLPSDRKVVDMLKILR